MVSALERGPPWLGGESVKSLRSEWEKVKNVDLLFKKCRQIERRGATFRRQSFVETVISMERGQYGQAPREEWVDKGEKVKKDRAKRKNVGLNIPSRTRPCTT